MHSANRHDSNRSGAGPNRVAAVKNRMSRFLKYLLIATTVIAVVFGLFVFWLRISFHGDYQRTSRATLLFCSRAN